VIEKNHDGVKMKNSITTANAINSFQTFDSILNEFLFPFTNGSIPIKHYTLKTDYFYEDGKIFLNVDVAGSAPEDVVVDFDKENYTLLVRVNKQYEKKDVKPTFYLRERVLSGQSRHFTLPTDIDANSITADVKNGLLTVKASIIKPEDKKPSTVTIKVN
jgi:HSP20 family protein